MIVLSKGGTPHFAVMSVGLCLILLVSLKAVGQPCSPSDEKETGPDLISGVREGELVCPSPMPTQSAQMLCLYFVLSCMHAWDCLQKLQLYLCCSPDCVRFPTGFCFNTTWLRIFDLFIYLKAAQLKSKQKITFYLRALYKHAVIGCNSSLDVNFSFMLSFDVAICKTLEM